MIKNLLFDLGGVILDIDRMEAVKALTAIGMRNPAGLLGDYGQKGPFLALERGDITPEEFHSALRPYFDREVSDDAIDAAFCEFLRGIPVERLHALERLHEHYNIYLLSNTNAVQWGRYIIPEFKKDGKEIDHYFDGLIKSFEVKAYKPEEAIYRAVIERLGIKPEETLFLDDSQTNLDAAEKLGFKTALVTADRGFIDILEA